MHKAGWFSRKDRDGRMVAGDDRQAAPRISRGMCAGPVTAYPEGMDDDQPHVLAAAIDVNRDEGAPTAVDADELTKARLDERWREFCLSAGRYAAETLRPVPRWSPQPGAS